MTRAPSPRSQVVALVAILIAAAVPVALAFGVDVCPTLVALGIELDACAHVHGPVGGPVDDLPSPEPASPGAPGDGGAP